METPGGPSGPDGSTVEPDGSQPDSAEADSGPGDADSAGATWTVFVYGNGDNNLANGLVADMSEMMKATIASNVQIVVLADFDTSETDPTGQPFSTGYALLRAVGGDKDFETIEEGAEISLTDPKTLQGMIKKVFNKYPAQRHGIVMWDHGGSWGGGFGPDEQDGADKTGKTLTMTEIAGAVKQGLMDAGLTAERPLDFFAFDTCLMGTAEVATEIASLTKVYIGDAEIDYGNGWDYTKVFTWLSAHSGASAQEFAKAEVGFWDEHHKSATMDDKLLRSHIALDMEKWDTFVAAAKAFADVAVANPKAAARPAFMDLPSYTTTVDNPEQQPHLRDLGHFLGLAGSDPMLGAAATTLRKALMTVTLAMSQGMLRQQTEQAGLQIALPIGKSYDAITDDYAANAPRWNSLTGWSKILAAQSAAADTMPPTVQHHLVTPTKLAFETTGADVGDARGYLAATVGGKQALVFPLGQGPIEPNAQYEIEWDGKWVVTDNASPQPVGVTSWYTIPSTGADGLDNATIFGMRFDLQTMSDGVVSVAFLSAEDPMMSTDSTPESDSALATFVVVLGDTPALMDIKDLFEAYGPKITAVPVMPVMGKDGLGYAAVGQPFDLPTKGLPLKLAAAPSGPYEYFTLVRDIWGNMAMSTDSTTYTAQ